MRLQPTAINFSKGTGFSVRQTFTQACGMHAQVDVPDCTKPGLKSGADQLSPQNEHTSALSAGDIEHSSKSSSRLMRTGKQSSMTVSNTCSMVEHCAAIYWNGHAICRANQPSRHKLGILSAAGLPPGAPISRPISPSPSPLLPISEADNGTHPLR